MLGAILLAADANVTFSMVAGKAFDPMFFGNALLPAIMLLLVLAVMLLKVQTPFAVMIPLGLIAAYTFWQFDQSFWFLYVLALLATGVVFIVALLNMTNR